MEKLTLVSVADLRWLELICTRQQCGASITFDMAGDGSFPEACPACRQTWNGFTAKPIADAFRLYKTFYSVYTQAPFRARFRVAEGAASRPAPASE